jgi:hypothetical protein
MASSWRATRTSEPTECSVLNRKCVQLHLERAQPRRGQLLLERGLVHDPLAVQRVQVLGVADRDHRAVGEARDQQLRDEQRDDVGRAQALDAGLVHAHLAAGVDRGDHDVGRAVDGERARPARSRERHPPAQPQERRREQRPQPDAHRRQRQPADRRRRVIEIDVDQVADDIEDEDQAPHAGDAAPARVAKRVAQRLMRARALHRGRER